MPTAVQLVRLYPRRWRERYGEELVATAGSEALPARTTFDIVMGAIDAWLSSEARIATLTYGMAAPAGGAARGGGRPMLKTMLNCRRSTEGVTVRGGLVGAGVMLALTVLFSAAGIILRRSGYEAAGETLKGLAFSGPFVLSMPFWLMRGQPWRAQAAIVGITFTILVALSYIATKI
jgi:hypothetical protein